MFALVLAWYAIEGKRWATIGYLAMVLLIPKPLFMPVAAWLLWKQPAARVPFALAFVFHAGLVLATGWGPEWIMRLLTSTDEMTSPMNYGPSRIVGIATMIIGLPLAAWLTWRGRLGFASLAASPYWLPSYLLMVLLEAMPSSPGMAVSRSPAPRSAA